MVGVGNESSGGGGECSGGGACRYYNDGWWWRWWWMIHWCIIIMGEKAGRECAKSDLYIWEMQLKIQKRDLGCKGILALSVMYTVRGLCVCVRVWWWTKGFQLVLALPKASGGCSTFVSHQAWLVTISDLPMLYSWFLGILAVYPLILLSRSNSFYM